MRILIVAKIFYPYQSPRAYRAFELARELAAQGHEVKVYTATGKFDYTSFEREFGVKVANIGAAVFDKLTSDNSLKLNYIDRVLGALLGKLFYFPRIETTFRLPSALKNESGYDMLISIASPYSIHWGCALALDKNRSLAKTWVADCGDPFMGNKMTKHPFYFRYIERWFCRKVDYLTIPIKEAITAYEEEFHHKIKVIPQGFKFDEIPVKYKQNKVPTFAYAGAFYKDKRDPSLFLSYLSSIDQDFKFIIYTKNTNLLLPFKEKLGDKLEVRNYVERSRLLEELSQMDFLVNFENNNQEQSPSKLIDYVLTGRPTLSVSSNILDENAILEFLSGKYDKQIIMKDKEQFNIVNVATEFLKLHKEDNFAPSLIKDL